MTSDASFRPVVVHSCLYIRWNLAACFLAEPKLDRAAVVMPRSRFHCALGGSESASDSVVAIPDWREMLQMKR